MSKTEWTTEKPTKPGYYWVSFKDDFPVHAVIGFLDKDKNGLYFSVDDEKFSIEAFKAFIGPIPFPQKPPE